MKKIFIIESPFQLSNALTISDPSKDIFIIRVSGFKKNDEQIINLIKKKNLRNIFILSIPYKNKAKLVKGILFSILLIIKNKFSHELYIGNYNSLWMKITSYFTSPFNIKVIDDGLITVSMIKKIEEKILNSKYPRRYILEKISPSFFTKYNIDSKYIKIIKIKTKNNEKKSIKIDENMVLFIGSPLVEKKVISYENLKIYSERVNNFFETKDIYYYSHRDENIKNLIGKKIDSASSIEDYLDTCDIFPRVIVSFYSSALLSIQNKYPQLEYMSFLISDEHLNSIYLNDIKNAYNFINTSNIKIIPS